MPRYFFDLDGEIGSLDEEGTECPDLYNAKIEAIRLMGEILREDAKTIFSIRDCGVIVRDNQGRRLARIQTSVASPLSMPDPGPGAGQADQAPVMPIYLIVASAPVLAAVSEPRRAPVAERTTRLML